MPYFLIGSSSVHRAPRYDFNDWNDWREADGFLCRSNKDCQWIDEKLNCEDYELDFTPLAGWFGGDTISIRGECTCEQGLFWNDNDLSCDRPIIFQELVPSLESLLPFLLCCFAAVESVFWLKNPF